VAARARALAIANGWDPAEQDLLEDLGRAHDIGKVTGTARPERSLEVLDACGIDDALLRPLVRWHDTALPWWNAVRKGQPPGDAAWRRLVREVDLRQLSLFMVADRVDAPGGWRRNQPTLWFHGEARHRGLLGPLVVDLPGVPSEISAGAVLIDGDGAARRALVIRVRAAGFELAKGGLEWDELPAEAACRELREEAAVSGDLDVVGRLGELGYEYAEAGERWHKRVHVFAARAAGPLSFGELPDGTRERRWVDRAEAATLPLVHESLRAPLLAAFEV
jgi:ADP-ribose pyrophosphatase YjhB (NUDIX family)